MIFNPIGKFIFYYFNVLLSPIFFFWDLYKYRDYKIRRNTALICFSLWIVLNLTVYYFYLRHQKTHLQTNSDLIVMLLSFTSLGWFFRGVIEGYAPTKFKNDFYQSEEWQELRVLTLRKYGRICMLCRAKDTELHVDHIKPKSKYPHLALDPDNLQVLCRQCNLGKSDKFNWDLGD